jgi:hypothetical protein
VEWPAPGAKSRDAIIEAVIWLAAMLLAISPGKKVVSQEAIARALEAVHRGGGADAASKLASLTDGMAPADITYAAVDDLTHPVVISESKAAAEWFYTNVLSGEFYASLGSHEADSYVMAKLVAKAEAYRARTPDKKDAVFEVTILGRRPFWLGPAEARTMVGELMLLVDKQLSSDLVRFQSTIWSLR